MTNEQNKSITVQTCKTREPIEFKSTVRLEGESGKDIRRIHSVSMYSKIVNKDVIESEMLFSGETSVFALYETDDGEFAEAKQEVTWEAKALMVGATALIASPEVVSYDILGFDSESITINLLHNIVLKEISNSEVSVEIEDSMGLEKDKESFEISKVAGANAGLISLSEEFEHTSSNITLLSRRVEVVADNCFSGIDAVTVSGNLYVTLLISDNGEIKTLNKVFPFKNEVECFGANPGNVVSATLKVAKTMIGTRENGENGSIIALDIEVGANVISYEMQEISVVRDAFSAVSKTSINVESTNCSNILNTAFGTVNVDFSASLEGKLGVDEVVSVINPKLEVTSAKINNSNCEMEGVVCATVVYNNNNENATESFEAICPFTASFEVGEGINSIGDFKININNYKLKAGSEIQLDADIYYTLATIEDKQIVYVSNIEYNTDVIEESSAIKVYTVKNGEKIFDIAKNLGVSISNLIAQNPDLESGVVAGEKVYVYVPLVINF